MKSWIAAWMFVFATGMLIAILANAEDRVKNRSVAALMVLIMIASGLIVVYR